MKPEEIKPDTGLCTILGYNAQTGYMRKYFNKLMTLNSLNATAIALNIKDEHFDVTMSSVGQSKVTQMMIEKDFGAKAIQYCANLNECASREGRLDFIEVLDDLFAQSIIRSRYHVDKGKNQRLITITTKTEILGNFSY